jgi:hypothetical protein
MLRQMLSLILRSYQFPLGEKTSVIAIANKGDTDEIADTVSILDGEGAFGALSKFGLYT